MIEAMAQVHMTEAEGARDFAAVLDKVRQGAAQLWNIHRLNIRASVIIVSLIQFAPLNAAEWRYFLPILSSLSNTFASGEAGSMLAGFCRTPIHNVQGVGDTCTIRRLGPRFSDITDRTFHPKTVIFGHFLGPSSDDAAITGWSAETHPYLWGSALLLTKHGDTWSPVWYRSALIIDSCEKVALADHREILLCEDEDSGMGHAWHYLYTVDFEHPSNIDQSLLAEADTFNDDCVQQSQILKALDWREGRQEFSVQVHTTGWSRISTESYCANYPNSRPPSLRLTFAVTPQGLTMMKREPLKR